jgi:hypothetical protein
MTASSGSSWSRADLEVGRVVPGRHLERAGAELRLDALVAITGTRRSTYGTTTSLPTRSR